MLRRLLRFRYGFIIGRPALTATTTVTTTAIVTVTVILLLLAAATVSDTRAQGAATATPDLVATYVAATVSALQRPAAMLAVRVLQPGAALTFDMALAPDGTLAAVYAGQYTTVVLGISVLEYEVDSSLLPVRLIDLDTGAVLHELTGSTDYVVDVAFTADSTTLVTAHRNGTLSFWDTQTGQRQRELRTVLGIKSVEALPDGQSLVLQAEGMVDQFLILDIASGDITDVWRVPVRSFGELPLASDPLSRVNYNYVGYVVTPDHARLLTASFAGEVLVWDTATLQTRVLRPRDAQPGSGVLSSLQLAGETLYYFDNVTGQIHAWNITTGTETATYAGSPAFAIAPGGALLARADETGLWIASLPGPAMQVYDGPLNARGRRPLLAFSQDGRRLVVGAPGVTADDPAAQRLLVVDFE